MVFVNGVELTRDIITIATKQSPSSSNSFEVLAMEEDPKLEEQWQFRKILERFDGKQTAVVEDTVNLNLGTEENPRNIPIGAGLSPKEKEDITRCLLDYQEWFAWSYEDMPGLDSDLVEHRLPLIPGAKPVKQKLRRLHPDLDLKVREEIQKL